MSFFGIFVKLKDITTSKAFKVTLDPCLVYNFLWGVAEH